MLLNSYVKSVYLKYSTWGILHDDKFIDFIYTFIYPLLIVAVTYNFIVWHTTNLFKSRMYHSLLIIDDSSLSYIHINTQRFMESTNT